MGSYMAEEKTNLEKGLVAFEGRWVTTAEREAILAERLDGRLRREEEKAERRRKAEEKRVFVRTTVEPSSGYYYRPSEFWPYYYRGPRRSTYSFYPEAVPTFDVFDYVKQKGAFPLCTPFDERSVDRARHDVRSDESARADDERSGQRRYPSIESATE